MHNTLRLAVALTLIVGLSQCYYFYGQRALAFVNLGQPDQPWCTLELRSNITDGGVNFQQNSHFEYNCSYEWNLAFDSLFDGIAVNDALAFSAPVNTYLYTTLDAAAVQRRNGTSCALIPQNKAPQAMYLCAVEFQNVHFYVEYFTSTPNPEDYLHDKVMLTNVKNIFNIDLTYNWLLNNNSFPNVVVDLFSACGSNNNTITDLGSPVTVSIGADLSLIIPNMTVRYILVKPRNSNAADYTVTVSPSTAQVFGSGSATGCYNLGFNYSAILANLNYCSGSGCEVSILMTTYGDLIYNLHTHGIVTAQPSSGNGGNGGNGGSGGNGGNGGSVGGGNGGNGGNGGGVVSSGLLMSFNVLMVLLLSYVYLA